MPRTTWSSSLCVNTVSPRRDLMVTGTISSAKTSLSMEAVVREWDRAAKVSISSRVTPLRRHNSSEVCAMNKPHVMSCRLVIM